MVHRRHTGGNKEFVYTDEDTKRIRNTDTKSTREFKKSLRDWRKRKDKINNNIWFSLLYYLIHSLCIYLFFILILPSIDRALGLENRLIDVVYISLIVGLLITIVMSILRAYLLNLKINFNSKLVRWFFIHSIGFFISYLIVDNLFSSISSMIIISLILGLGVYGFTKIYQKFMFKKRSKFYFSSIPFWVWILLIVILLIVSSHVYVTYETKKISSNSLYCEDGNLYQKNGLMDFISSMTIEMELGISCIEYKTSRCKPSCVDEKPVCKCQATIWNMIFPSRNPFGVFE